MDTIVSIKEALSNSERPVAKALHKTENGSSICIGFKKGMELKEHKTNKPTTLLVLYGSINYREGDDVSTFSQFDEYEIPVSVFHAVEAREDSMIMLLQG